MYRKFVLILGLLTSCHCGDQIDTSLPSMLPAEQNGCEYQGHTTVLDGATWNGASFSYLSFSTPTQPGDIVKIEIYPGDPYYGPTDPGIYSVDEINYQDCGLCVLAFKNCDSTGLCDAMFYADEGSVTIDSFGGVFVGSFADIVLREVTISPTTFLSTPVLDGPCWEADGFSFNVPSVGG